MVVYFLYSSHVFLWNHRPALISFVGKSLERVIHPGNELSTLHEMVCCPCSWGFCWYWWLWYISLSEHFNWCSYWLQQTLLSQHACELIKIMAIWTTCSPLKLQIMICNLFHRRSCQGWTWEVGQCWRCLRRFRPNQSQDSPGHQEYFFFVQVDVNENYFVKVPTRRGRFSVAQEQPSLPERRVQITQSSVNSEHKHFSKRDWTFILSRFCCRQNLWESSLQIEHSPWPCGGWAGFARLWRRGPLNLAWAGTFQPKKKLDCHFTREKKQTCWWLWEHIRLDKFPSGVDCLLRHQPE